MTLSDAISLRFSSRSYTAASLTADQQIQLQKAITACNKRSGLHVRLICDQPKPFASILRSYGMLRGVRHFFIFAGNAADPHLEEKCGYFGEQLILTATALGLGTCWVGGTFDRGFCKKYLSTGEKLVCVAAVGHVADTPTDHEKLISRFTKRSTKSAEALASTALSSCHWFLPGIAAVQRAPSAMNRQGYRFHQAADGTVTAHLTTKGPFTLVDLGIAKLHFELGAHGGTWRWGDGGSFHKAKEEKSCGAVIWRAGSSGPEYLLARHKGGHWSFPKGHVEDGETEEETARREILEETGLHAVVDTTFRQTVTYYPKPNVIKDVIFFLASVEGGTQHAQEAEIAELGWFSFQQARPLVTFATDVDVLISAHKRLTGKS